MLAYLANFKKLRESLIQLYHTSLTVSSLTVMKTDQILNKPTISYPLQYVTIATEMTTDLGQYE